MNGGSQGRWRYAALTCGLLLIARSLVVGAPATPFRPRLPDESLWPQGRYVYQRHCLVCHGAFGDGRGEMSLDLKPQPRNFGRGVFKYRSTPAGALPTDADLERVIRAGLAGTAMPAFTGLDNREIRAVVEFVKSFSSRWGKPINYAPTLVPPTLPPWFKNEALLGRHAEKGRTLFNTACAVCHGPDGSGRGTASKDLQDSFGQSVDPSDMAIQLTTVPPTCCGRESGNGLPPTIFL